MGRIRTIKPEFPHSESMGRVSRDARLCFVLLWTIADDSGRARGSSRMLASLLFPYDDDAPKLMPKWLSELEKEGCIKRYSVGGSCYIEIAKWLSHQKIDKPSPSRLPAFVDDSSRIREDSREVAEGSALDLGPRTVDLGMDHGPRNGKDIAPSALSVAPARKRAGRADKVPTGEVWNGYATAYRERYGVDPVRNAKVNGQLAQLIARLGADEAPGVARSYLANRNALYVASKHCVDLLLRDAEKLRTEWVTGQVTHQKDAREADRLSSTAGMAERVIAHLEAKGIK